MAFDIKKFLTENRIVLNEIEKIPLGKLDDEEIELLASIGNRMGMSGGPYLTRDTIEYWDRKTAVSAVNKAMGHLTASGQKMAKSILKKIQ